MIYYGKELYHHGIKGQKWGDRNYQYEDGSLTPEGKKRYGVGEKKRGLSDKAKRNLKIAAGVTIGAAATAAATIGAVKAAKSFKNDGKVAKLMDHFMEKFGRYPAKEYSHSEIILQHIRNGQEIYREEEFIYTPVRNLFGKNYYKGPRYIGGPK